MKLLLRGLNFIVYGSIFLVTTVVAFWLDWRYGVVLLGLYLGAYLVGSVIGWVFGRSAPTWMRAGEVMVGACRRSRLALGFAVIAVTLAVGAAFLVATEDDPLFARIILVGVMAPAAGYGVYYRVRRASVIDDNTDEAGPRPF
jgi:hypothetical protein